MPPASSGFTINRLVALVTPFIAALSGLIVAWVAKQLAAGGTLILLVGIGYEVHRHKSIDGDK